MKLREFKEAKDDSINKDSLEMGYKNPAKKSDTRRTRLTLEHLNKLRSMRELRNKEQEEEKKQYAVIYARPAA